MLGDFERFDPSNAEFYASARADFDAYVQSLLDHEQGFNLPDGWVQCTHRWLADATGQLVGVTRFRHNIGTAFLAEEAGHIGYDVSPSHRGKGFGHRAMQVGLSEAAKLGLERVLLIAGERNAASRAVVEAAGGILDGIRYSSYWNENVCRYWVAIRAEA